MKIFFRKLFSPLLNLLEQGGSPVDDKPLNRRILIAVGLLFALLAGAVIGVLLFAQSFDYLLPAVLFSLLALLCLITGLFGDNRAVAKLWGSDTHKLVIREEVAADHAAISDVIERAFGKVAAATLVESLRSRGELLISLVAIEGEQIIGHVALSPMTVASGEPGVFAGVAPLSVMPNLQGRGVGGELVRAAEALARSKGVDALFLLRHPGYYPRFGYIESTVANEYGASDAFMHLELTKGVLTGVEGPAKYTSAFSQIGV